MPYPTARWENPPNLISSLMVYSAWGLESVRCSKSGTTGWRYLPAAKLESSPAKVSSENFANDVWGLFKVSFTVRANDPF